MEDSNPPQLAARDWSPPQKLVELDPMIMEPL